MKIPILKLKKILLTSIQIDLTDEEALEFQSDLLHIVTETEARGVVIDVTALEVVDSFMGRVITDTTTMLRMLGAELVVCGIQPAVAQVLIEMGRGLFGVHTALNLDQGMEKIQRLIEE